MADTKSYTFRIPNVLLARLKLRAAADNVKAAQVVIEACRAYLDELPAVELPAPDASGYTQVAANSGSLCGIPRTNDVKPTIANLRALTEAIMMAEPKPIEAPAEVNVCGFISEYDQETGERYRCTKLAHSGKVSHGGWVKV